MVMKMLFLLYTAWTASVRCCSMKQARRSCNRCQLEQASQRLTPANSGVTRTGYNENTLTDYKAYNFKASAGIILQDYR